MQLIKQGITKRVPFPSKVVYKFSSFDAHANPIFMSSRILKFEDYNYQTPNRQSYVSLHGDDLLPSGSNDVFWLQCDVHSYNTTSKNSFRLP